MRQTAVAMLLMLGVLGCRRDPTLSTAAQKPGYTRTPAPAPAAKFDMYVMRIDWVPEYCRTLANEPECKAAKGYSLRTFSPRNSDGSRPTGCAKAAGLKKPAEFSDLSPDPADLDEIWQEGGPCSGLDPVAYFTLARKAYSKISFPPLISTLKAPDMMQTDRIISRFESVNPLFPKGTFRVQCEKEHFTAVEACLSKELTPTQCGEQVPECKTPDITVTPKPTP